MGKPELPPLPAYIYRTVPIDVYLRQGHEPLVSIHLNVRAAIKIRSLLGRIAAQVKALDAANVVLDRRVLSAPTSSVTCSRRVALDVNGEEIPYPHCPDPNVQIVDVVPPDVTPADLAASYEALAKACRGSVRIGERLDIGMRELAGIPYEVDDEVADVWTTLSTGGVPGWTTKQAGVPGIIEFDYVVARSDG